MCHWHILSIWPHVRRILRCIILSSFITEIYPPVTPSIRWNLSSCQGWSTKITTLRQIISQKDLKDYFIANLSWPKHSFLILRKESHHIYGSSNQLLWTGVGEWRCLIVWKSLKNLYGSIIKGRILKIMVIELSIWKSCKRFKMRHKHQKNSKKIHSKRKINKKSQLMKQVKWQQIITKAMWKIKLQQMEKTLKLTTLAVTKSNYLQ